MSVTRTPDGTAPPNGRASLSRVNNDQKQWFAQTDKRFQQAGSQVDALVADGDAPQEEYNRLEAEMKQVRDRMAKEWASMKTDLVQRQRQEAVLQGETRWRDMLGRLNAAMARLATVMEDRYPDGRRGGGGESENEEHTAGAAAPTSPQQQGRGCAEEKEEPRRQLYKQEGNDKQTQHLLQAVLDLQEQLHRRDAELREEWSKQRRQDLQELAHYCGEERRRHAKEDREEISRLHEEVQKLQLQQQQQDRHSRYTERSMTHGPRVASADVRRPASLHPGEQGGSQRGRSADARVGMPPWGSSVESESPGAGAATQQQQGGHLLTQQAARQQAIQQNEVLQRYARHVPNYGIQQQIDPFASLMTDEDDDYYRTSFLYPFNEPPPPGSQEITEYKKIDGLTPKFSGKESDFPSWVAMFVPNVHRTRCPVSWKVMALYKALDNKDERLSEIIAGVGSTPQDYARTINRLIRAYLHPQGLLAAKKAALDEIKYVRKDDTLTIEKWHLRLEQLCDMAITIGKVTELLTQQMYESSLAKMDKEMAKDYLIWCRNKNFPKDTLTVLTWLGERVEDSRVVSRHAAKAIREDHPGEQRRQQASFLTRRERNMRSPRVQRQRAQGDPPEEQQQEKFRQRQTRNKCPMDGLEHGLAACDLFKGLSVTERRNRLREWRRCYSCLQPGHNIHSCNKGITCAHCPHNHHTLIHGSGQVRRTTHAASQQRAYTVQTEAGKNQNDWSEDSAPEDQIVSLNTSQRKEGANVALQTLPVDVYNNQKKITVNLLMDPGATGAFMSKEAAKQLQVTGHAMRTTITGFGGQRAELDVVVAKVLLAATGEKKKHWLQVQILDDPAASYRPFDWLPHKHKHHHLKNLPLKPPAPGPVHIMVGMDAPQLVSSLIPDLGGTDRASPIARYTRLGWVVGGPTGTNGGENSNRSTFAFYTKNRWTPPDAQAADNWRRYQFGPTRNEKEQKPRDAREVREERWRDEHLNAELARMWEVDAAAGKPPNTWSEEEVFQKLKDSIRMEQGHYVLPTLWKEGQPRLHNNYNYALKRLLALKSSKLFRDTSVATDYDRQIKELIRDNYVERVQTNNPEREVANYLPHFPVVRPDKTSTKVRLIMDAAARSGKKICLNDCLYKGPKLINELVSVLLRFRANNFTLAADVKKMFFQITLEENDRDFHRFLWTDEEDKIQVFRWKVHPFGSAASPCIAMFAIKYHAGKWKEQFPRAAETIIHSTLVDDNMDSVETEEEAIELGQQLVQLYEKAGMKLGKVLSNSSTVLRTFPEEMIAPSLEVAGICAEDLYLPLVKALGVIYVCKEDAFTFRMEKPSVPRWSKREILKFEAKLYDPHGLIMPHTTRARIILQKLWRAGIDWDEAVPQEILAEWKMWLKATEALPELRVPRCIHQVGEEEQSSRAEVHIFCDASADAYAAAAYFVATYPGGRQARLVISKAKVAPLHLTSIPRLELMSAVLALDLKLALQQALPVRDGDFVFWTDSRNVICWLEADSRMLHTFVGTRIAKIQQQTSVQQWR